MADGVEVRAGGTEGRLAVLEQIAADIRALLDRMDEWVDQMDDRLPAIDGQHCVELWWMIGVMMAGFAGLLGKMAYGFNWL